MITPIFAAIAGFMLIFLSFGTIKVRKSQKIALGDNESIELKKWIRAHGNFTEYAPLTLILLFIAEYMKVSKLEIALAGTLFIVSRFLHAYSLTKDEKYENGQITQTPKFRMMGMILTFLVIFFLCFRILISYIL